MNGPTLIYIDFFNVFKVGLFIWIIVWGYKLRDSRDTESIEREVFYIGAIQIEIKSDVQIKGK